MKPHLWSCCELATSFPVSLQEQSNQQLKSASQQIAALQSQVAQLTASEATLVAAKVIPVLAAKLMLWVLLVNLVERTVKRSTPINPPMRKPCAICKQAVPGRICLFVWSTHPDFDTAVNHKQVCMSSTHPASALPIYVAEN